MSGGNLPTKLTITDPKRLGTVQNNEILQESHGYFNNRAEYNEDEAEVGHQ